MAVKLVPPFDEKATSIAVTPTLSEAVHCTTYGVPAKTRSPPLGRTSVTVGGVVSTTVTSKLATGELAELPDGSSEVTR